jgi:hypothetical protein
MKKQTLKARMLKPFDSLELKDIESIYSGKAGKCMCGCSGKYTYATINKVKAGKERGYEVGDEECNDKVVKMLLKRMKNFVSNGVALQLGTSYYFITVGERTYTLYII